MRTLVAAVALLGIAGGCSERRGGPREAVVIATGMSAHAALIQVAAASGFFAAEGLEVTVHPYPSGKIAVEAMLAGKADLATCAETVVVFAALKDRRVSLLASIASSSSTTAVIARDEVVSTPADLAGRRVGLARGTSAEFFLDTLLLRHAVDRGAVRLVDLQPEALAEALATGAVDAVAIWEPYVTVLKRRLGDRGRIFRVDDLYAETHDLVSRPDLVRERPEALAKVLRALLRAEALFRDRPDQARQAVASGLMLGPSEADAVLARFDYRVRLDQSLLVLMEEEGRWAIRTGLVPKQNLPNFLTTIAAEPLLGVKPEAVGLIR